MSPNLPADPRGLPPEPLGTGSPFPATAFERWAPPPHEEDGTNWRRYVAALLRYKWLILAITVAGTGGGVLATRFLDPTYVAQGTVWAEAGAAAGRADRGPIRSGQLLDSYAWIDLLKSYVVLDAVVREQQLFVTPESHGDSALFRSFALKERFAPGAYVLAVSRAGDGFTLQTAEGVVVQRGAPGDSIGAEVGFAWAPSRDVLVPGREVRFAIVTPRDAARKLRERVRAMIDRDGNFIRVELEGTNPQRVAGTVNGLLERYVEVAAELKRQKLTELTRILDEQLRYAYQNLRQAEIALEDFRVRTITLPSEGATPVAGGIEMTRDPVFTNFFEMKIQREQLRRDRDAIERILVAAPDSGLSVDGLVVIGAVQQSAELRQALDVLTNQQAELRSLQLRYTEENPQVQRAAGDVATMTRQTIPQIARRLVADVRAREAELDGRIAAGARDLEEIPTRAIEEARLRRQVAIAENLYTNLQQRFEEARLAEASAIPDISVLDAAVVPRQPVKNTAPRVLAVALLGSLALALALAILLDRIDRRLRYPEQITTELGLPILGAVPHAKGINGNGRRGTETAQVLEALRGVRLSLTHAYGAAGPLLVTVSSPGPGDGKSFIASNLALAFADAGHQTLLIDGDVRRGELHKLLGGRRKPGLVDYLNGDVPREAIVQRTKYSSLWLIGGGTRKQAAPELLSSGGMAELLVGLRSNYGVVIIDSPPLGAGVDPYVLGTGTGSMLLVLRTGVTDRELAEAKLEVLDRLPIRILGAVLNDVRPTGPYRYYGYHYYVEGYEAVDEEEPEQLPSAQ